MTIAYENVYQHIRSWAELQGIQVRESQMPAGNAGEFNGLSVTMNSKYDPQERTYYLIHALGSIVRWSLDKVAVQGMFDELSAAKNHKADLHRLESAIARYRAFEAESSAFAVWLLAELGSPEAVPSYTNFMRADLESMTEFHRHGRAPVWRSFFARWNERVACGRRKVAPFQAKPIAPFQPVPIERQEILQQQDAS